MESHSPEFILNACFQSVLQQQASRNLKCECNFSSLQANHGTAGQPQLMAENNVTRSHVFNNTEKSLISSPALTPPKPNLLQQNILKKQGVSGESCDANFIGCSSDILIRKFEKDFK